MGGGHSYASGDTTTSGGGSHHHGHTSGGGRSSDHGGSSWSGGDHGAGGGGDTCDCFGGRGWWSHVFIFWCNSTNVKTNEKLSLFITTLVL